MMWGDDYLPHNPEPDRGSPWIAVLWIIAAVAVVLACLPGWGS